MNRAISVLAISICLITGGCGRGNSAAMTLYRNSPVDIGMRVHFATFDAGESDAAYNLNNCQMAARLLNANSAARARSFGKEPDTAVGFWCEPGGFNEKGPVPSHFESQYPTDVD